MLKLNRNGATLLSTYDPVGAVGEVNSAQNVDSWSCQALTVCGFRQWVEHFQSGLAEWLDAWEVDRLAREKAAREAALAAAREVVNLEEQIDVENQPNPEAIFVMPDSLKRQELDKSDSQKDLKASKKKSSGSRKSLKSAKSSSSRSSSKTKLKAKSSRSSSRASDRVGSKSKKASPSQNPISDVSHPTSAEKQTFAYKAYELKDIIVAAGTERKILTADGGSIRVKQSGFLHQSDNLSIVIENDDSLLHIFQAAPRDAPAPPTRQRTPTPQPKESGASIDECIDNEDVKSVASSSFEKDDEEIPLARFSSVYCSFSDGIKASYSLNGPSGKPKNWEAESILEERKYGHKLLAVSPTPSRETNTSAKSKGKKGKKSDTSVTSAPSHTDETEKKEDKDEQHESLQQVYISTPDGLELRFGHIEGRGLVCRMSRPGVETRVITQHRTIRLLGDESDFECLDHEARDGSVSGVKNGEHFDQAENVLSYTASDPITGHQLLVRSDGYMRVERSDEMLHQFPEGTRVTIGETETRVEHPDCPMVVYEEAGDKCIVVMANGALVQVESNGNYHVTSSNGGSFAVGQDGTVLFNSREAASTHIVRQKSAAVLEVIEPDGMTTIQIGNTGATSILHSMGESEEQEQQPEEPVNASRYFYLANKEAYEFHTHDKGQALLNEIERDEHCAVLYQPVPDGANEKAATLVCPFDVNYNWSQSPYQEDKIIPAYLQQAEVASKSR